MLKTILLAAGAMIASPLLAQTSTAAPQTQPSGPAAQTGSSSTTAVPAANASPAQTPTPGQPAATGNAEVEQIIGREFGAYDKNKDGKLSQAEFDTWMVALKTASDPATRADAPATRAWLGAAFAQADLDKSRDVTQAELTGFLTQGQS